MIVLASASPRRAELLTAAAIPFEVSVADIDETQHSGETPESYVQRLAIEKAQAIVRRGERRPTLGADTAVVIDGHTLGKPADVDDARRMLQMLSGRTHRVVTGVALVSATAAAHLDAASRPVVSGVTATDVTFAPISAMELESYLASGEPMGKAGGYAIQGRASRFVLAINGSYANVVGLPVADVWRMCSDLGILVS
jgi:septum formation protein